MLFTRVVPSRRSVMLHRIAALVVGLLAASAQAQSTAVIPPGAANLSNAPGFADTRPLGAAEAAVYQVIYDEALLASIPRGSVITGLQVRQNSTNPVSAWPPIPLTITRYDITMGSSDRTPATKSTTFAENFRNPVLVRSGPLNLAANAYPGGPAGSAPKPFGPLIPFTTGYVYSGGPLVIMFRVSHLSSPSAAADVFEIPGQAGELATNSSSDATDATEQYSGSGVVVRLTFTPPPTDLAKGVTKVTMTNDFVSNSSTVGSGALTWTTPITNVGVMNANQFSTIGPGSELVGVAHRLYTFWDIWPAAAANFSNYEIQLSKSQTNPGALSNTIASNVGADAVIARTGPLSIPINTLKPRNGQSITPFSWEIAFDAPYTYRGGPLLSVVRHTGHGVPAGILDAIADEAFGFGSLVDAKAAESASAIATTDMTPFPISRYSVDAGTSSPLNQVDGVGNNSTLFLAGRMQIVLSASELRYIPVGSVIDSLWLRQSPFATEAAPSTDKSILDCEIALSTAASDPIGIVSDFAANQGPDRVVVHDGPLAFTAGTFPPGNNGKFGKFAQLRRPFIYKGGPLCIDIRNRGGSGLIGQFGLATNSESTNRGVLALNPDDTQGFLLNSGPLTGIAVKLGYIPSVQTPNSLATGTSVADWGAPQIPSYAFQFIIPASELLSVDHGSEISGISFRRATSQSSSPDPFPTTETTVPRFDVSISGSNRSPLNMSPVFAENVGMDEVLARSGPLTIPANAFPASGLPGTPNDNAWYINFDRGYIYQGGDLCVTVRGEGQISATGALEGTTTVRTAAGAALYNYSNANATSGFFYGPMAVRFAFTPRAFCPADLNNDGIVDDFDFQVFVLAYDILDCNDPSMPAACPSDLNFDRIVEDLDFQVFVLAYNEVLCP
ncbi:MAG TPA: hypothetical protein VF777_10665 [Phycisphaerales bacterium]